MHCSSWSCMTATSRTPHCGKVYYQWIGTVSLSPIVLACQNTLALARSSYGHTEYKTVYARFCVIVKWPSELGPDDCRLVICPSGKLQAANPSSSTGNSSTTTAAATISATLLTSLGADLEELCGSGATG